MDEAKAPLRIIAHDQFCVEKKSQPCGFVIYGASGDLSHRKLFPALYELFKNSLLPAAFFVIGFARKPWSETEFRQEVAGTLGSSEDEAQKAGEFLERVFYCQGDYDSSEDFGRLAGMLRDLHERFKTRGNMIHYLATPAEVYQMIVAGIGKAGLTPHNTAEGPWSNVIIEKPFGADLVSATALQHAISEHLREEQIYRIDHYMGKETVQNILMFRFTNSIFEPVWNHQHIDHIQITMAETLGVEHRAGYYDCAGALRDMFQNHMFQLMSLVAMEPPQGFDPQLYRDEKVRLARSLRPIPEDRLDEFVVRGQYGPGKVDGIDTAAYRNEAGIRPDSNTETFVAMKLFVDNWRWAGVPFYLRSGKRMARQTTEIAVVFKSIPHSIFPQISANQFSPNVLIFRIQPDEGISLSFEAKHPGPKLCMATLKLEFNYKDIFREEPMEAYERLILDCTQGDQTLFVRQDMIEGTWGFLGKIINRWEAGPGEGLVPYPAGSWGPEASRMLIEKDDRRWIGE
ncbi:MAG: glucose-6-phosphate dehydrogenase [Candidatus Omnitrophica bacterium]|nr:glucose-6-phosphate dehydrogenase [Candidatus Omnitrophota bacterium]